MKQFVITLAALAALTSCSKNDELEPGGAHKAEIQVTASVDGAQTKSYVDSHTGLTNVSFVVKEGTTTPADFTSGTRYTGNVAATTGKVKFATAPVYNTNDDNVWFVAYHPGSTPTGNIVEWTIDGQTDIMTTNAVWSAGKYSSRISTGLRFNHQLARIEVLLKAEATASLSAVQAAWGNIQKIEVLGTPNKMKYDLAAATPAISSSGSADFALLANYEGDTFAARPVPDNTNTFVNAVAMLAPVAVTTTESFKLKVTAAGDGKKNIEVEVPVNLDNNLTSMTAGHTHIVTLTFKANKKRIEVTTSTVNDWMTGTGGSHEVDRPEPSIIEYGVAPFDITSGAFGNTTYAIPTAITVSYDNMATGTYYQSYDMTDIITSEPPYIKFEVAKEDGDGGVIESTWETAKDICKSKTTDGGGWRMPRLSELMLIYLNKDALKNVPGFTEFREYSTLYWSATEYDENYRWTVYFSSGAINNSGYGENRVRCIREIPMPSTSIIVEYGKAPLAVTRGSFNGVTYTIPPATNSYTSGKYYDNIADILTYGPPYIKFEIATEDQHSNDDTFAFQDALNSCATKSPAGEWRLPRLSELMLLYQNKAALEAISGFAKFAASSNFVHYWSASYYYNSYYAYYLGFSNGAVDQEQCLMYKHVRCIREIH